MNNQSKVLIAQLKEGIAKDEIESVVQQLKSLLAHTPKLNSVLQQEARHKDIIHHIHLGTIDFDKASAVKNQIRLSLLQLIDEIGTQESTSASIATELEQAIKLQNSKNVVIGSTISAGGDIQIGDKIETESETSRKLRLFLFLFVPMLAIFGSWFWFKYEDSQRPLQLKVLIDNKTPHQHLPNPSGSLQLIYGGKNETEKQVKTAHLFEHIPANFSDSEMRIKYAAEGFEPIDTSFLYQNVLTLPLYRNADLASLKGNVDGEIGRKIKDLQGVRVSILGCCETLTDAHGDFTLNIPFEYQREEQRLEFQKNGYEKKSTTEPVFTTDSPVFFMKKK